MQDTTRDDDPSVAQQVAEDLPAQPHRIIVNEPFAQALGTDGLADYVRRLADIAESSRGRSPALVAGEIHEVLAARGVELPEVSVSRMAERLTDPDRGELVIRLNNGEILFGHATEAAAPAEPSSAAGTADPEHPDRPAYT